MEIKNSLLFPKTYHIPISLAEAATFMMCMRKVVYLNLYRDTGYRDQVFRSFLGLCTRTLGQFLKLSHDRFFLHPF
jgi:hypothetical protein